MVILTLACGVSSQSTLHKDVSDKDEMLATLLDTVAHLQGTVAQHTVELGQVNLTLYNL